MEKVDELSKRPDQKVRVEKDNKNQKLIKKKWIYSSVEVVIKGPKVDIIEKLKIAREKNKEVVRVVKEIKKTEVKVLRDDEWQIEGEVVLRKEKIYVLKDEKLRIEIIKLHHNVLVARHRERWKTMKLVMRNYQWPGVTKNMGKYVDKYNFCQRMKNRIKAPEENLMVNEIPEKL